jgi:hypothetical protein
VCLYVEVVARVAEAAVRLQLLQRHKAHTKPGTQHTDQPGTEHVYVKEAQKW